MYNSSNEYFRPQNMNYMNMPMNMAPMEDMQDMGYQMPYAAAPQQPSYAPMHTMAPMHQMPQMQPMQPMQPMGTVTGAIPGINTLVPGTTSGSKPTNIGSIPVATEQFAEAPVFDTQYTQGYLRTQIGKRVKVEFLIGTNMLVDREGTLVDVGISYIIINEVETDDLLLCDIYSIKFVRFYF